MTLIVETHEEFLAHDTGPGHPERPTRLAAVAEGVRRAELADAIVEVEPRLASLEEIALVHPHGYLSDLEAACAVGGRLDPDTVAVPRSFDAALRAAGAGLDAVERLRAGEGEAAFCAVRPPGHHATPTRPMGFCLVNNVAVCAAALADAGERVLVVDYDAHHGNGTQDAFYHRSDVVYVSFHQFPFYPGTGALHETGGGEGTGATINVPLPAGATGDVYRRGVDEVVVPLAERWKPTWLLLSAGFDAHRADPLTQLGLSAGDFGALTRDLVRLVDPGRRVLFLEGGYDLAGLRDSVGAALAAVLDVEHDTETETNGGPGRDVIDEVVAHRASADPTALG